MGAVVVLSSLAPLPVFCSELGAGIRIMKIYFVQRCRLLEDLTFSHLAFLVGYDVSYTYSEYTPSPRAYSVYRVALRQWNEPSL